MEEALNLITSLGYPAAITLMLMWYINKKDESHKEESKVMTEAVNNNTNIITKLYEHIVRGEQIE